MGFIFSVPRGRLTKALARKTVGAWLTYCRQAGRRDRCALPDRVRAAFRLFTGHDRKKQPKALMVLNARNSCARRKAHGGYVRNLEKVRALTLPAGGNFCFEIRARAQFAARSTVIL